MRATLARHWRGPHRASAARNRRPRTRTSSSRRRRRHVLEEAHARLLRRRSCSRSHCEPRHLSSGQRFRADSSATDESVASPASGTHAHARPFFQSLTFSPDGRRLVFTATPVARGSWRSRRDRSFSFVKLGVSRPAPATGTEGTSGLGTGVPAPPSLPTADGSLSFADRKAQEDRDRGRGADRRLRDLHGVRSRCGLVAGRHDRSRGQLTSLSTRDAASACSAWPRRAVARRSSRSWARTKSFTSGRPCSPTGESALTVIDQRGEWLEVVDLESGVRRRVDGVAQVSRPQYLDSGHLLYVWAASCGLLRSISTP